MFPFSHKFSVRLNSKANKAKFNGRLCFIDLGLDN